MGCVFGIMTTLFNSFKVIAEKLYPPHEVSDWLYHCIVVLPVVLSKTTAIKPYNGVALLVTTTDYTCCVLGNTISADVEYCLVASEK